MCNIVGNIIVWSNIVYCIVELFVIGNGIMYFLSR